MVVEALELAVVRAVSELLVNEEREASRASQESIREDGSIVLLWRFKENLVFLVRFRWDLGVKRRDRGSENQFSDKLGQTSPEFCPRAVFGGEFCVAFDQLGEEDTSSLTVLRVANCHHLKDGALVGRREWGQGRSAAAGANESEKKQRSMRESLFMTFGSALIFIEPVSA